MISKLYHSFNIEASSYGFFVAKNRVLGNISMVVKIRCKVSESGNI
jgi:hypothetical protein